MSTTRARSMTGLQFAPAVRSGGTPVKSRTMALVQKPMGRSTSTGWAGWPRGVPLSTPPGNGLTGDIADRCSVAFRTRHQATRLVQAIEQRVERRAYGVARPSLMVATQRDLLQRPQPFRGYALAAVGQTAGPKRTYGPAVRLLPNVRPILRSPPVPAAPRRRAPKGGVRVGRNPYEVVPGVVAPCPGSTRCRAWQLARIRRQWRGSTTWSPRRSGRER